MGTVASRTLNDIICEKDGTKMQNIVKFHSTNGLVLVSLYFMLHLHTSYTGYRCRMCVCRMCRC